MVFTIGGTSGAIDYSGNFAVASPITLPSSGTVTSIGINFYVGSGNVRVALYSVGTGKPGNLLTQSASTALSGSAGWRDIAVTPCYVTAGSYWVVFNFDKTIYVYYSPGSRCYYGKPFGAFDATWSASSGQDSYYQVNVRVTYTTG